MLAIQLDRLSAEEQQVLEVGSVVGKGFALRRRSRASEFSAAAVAAGLGDDVVRIDERCAALARRSQLLDPRGEQTWPDGTVAGCYGFVHALYQEVLYSRLTAARRVYLPMVRHPLAVARAMAYATSCRHTPRRRAAWTTKTSSISASSASVHAE